VVDDKVRMRRSNELCHQWDRFPRDTLKNATRTTGTGFVSIAGDPAASTPTGFFRASGIFAARQEEEPLIDVSNNACFGKEVMS
jgi:hypothetical protein